MTASPQSIQPSTELDEWKQAASVEAGLRREFYDRALTAEASLQEAYAGHREQKAEIAALRAKVDELTAALREISDLYVNAPGWAAPAPSHQREYKMHKIAHTAITSTVNSQHSDGETGR